MGSLILRSRVEAIISYILSYQKEIQVRMELLRILVILVQMLSLSLCGPAGQYFSSEPADTTAVAGGHLQLECVVENRKGQCQWTKDGFGLGLAPDIPGFPRFSMSDYNLNIFPVLAEDEGDYQCQVLAVPGAPAIVSDTATVSVIAAPGQPYIKQAREVDMLEVEEGEEVVLDCESHGARPAAEIHWTDENGKEIMSNLMETVSKIKKTKTFKTVSTLRMKPTRPMSLTCSASNAAFKEPRNSRALDIQLKLTASEDTEDEYTCKVFVDGHDILTSETATLRILRKPEIVTEPVRYAKIGEDVILACKVESLSETTKI